MQCITDISMIENRRIVLLGLVYTLVPVIIEGPMIYYTT